MKVWIVVFALLVFISFPICAQIKSQLSAHFSYNEAEVEYQYCVLPKNGWIAAYLGVGNQDINQSFDDPLGGLRLGVPVWCSGRSELDVTFKTGFYHPNNNYFTATTLTCGGGVRYNLLLGKTKRHSLLVNAGYEYGKRSYQQEFASESIYISTIGTFETAPLYLSIGYGFIF
jgi:hypothetical protein